MNAPDSNLPAAAAQDAPEAERQWTLAGSIRAAWQQLGSQRNRAVGLAAVLSLALAVLWMCILAPAFNAQHAWVNRHCESLTSAQHYALETGVIAVVNALETLAIWLVYCGYLWWAVRSYEGGRVRDALSRPLMPERLWRIATLVLAYYLGHRLLHAALGWTYGLGREHVARQVLHLVRPALDNVLGVAVILVAAAVLMTQARPHLRSALRGQWRFAADYPGRAALVLALAGVGGMVPALVTRAVRWLPGPYLGLGQEEHWHTAVLIVSFAAGHLFMMLVPLTLLATMFRAARGLPLETAGAETDPLAMEGRSDG